MNNDIETLFTTGEYYLGPNNRLIFDPLDNCGSGALWLAISCSYGDLRVPISTPELLSLMAKYTFINRHDITEEEFETNHYQTLFRIEHPEASL